MTKQFSNFTYILFCILPILDSLNGFLIRNRGLTIGPLYHSAYAVVLFFIALYESKWKMKKKYRGAVFLFLFALFASVLLNSLFDQSFIFDYSRALKFVTTFLYFVSFMVMTQNDSEIGFKVLDYTSIAIPTIQLVLRITGLGYNYYSGGFSGYVGWYSSLDELNAILAILLLYLIMTFHGQKTVYYIRIVIISVCMILASSKASILIMLFVLGYFVILNTLKVLRRTTIRVKTILLVSLLVIAAVCIVVPVAKKLSASFITRQKYLYGISGGFISYFTSGRTDKMYDLIVYPLNSIKSNPILYYIRLLFGNGFMHYRYYGFISEYQFEMELFDSYYWMGIPGIVVYIYYFVFCWKRTKRTQTSSHKYISFIILLGISFLIGHILYAGVASIYFCLFFAMLCNNDFSMRGSNLQ